MSNSSNHNIATLKNKKKLFLGLFASIMLVTAIVSIVAAVTSSKSPTNSNNDHQVAHAIIKSSCSSTSYSDLCFSAISAVPDATSKIKSTKDVIDLFSNLTTSAAQHSYFKIHKLTSARRSFTERETTGLHDCLVMLNETLYQLSKVYQELQDYPSLNKSLSAHADDLKILLSAAITNQETCFDGFSHDKADKKVQIIML
ncbi:unnamed protein product [Dovyalis caffra]|uniref:pectinesterase n=1 Tax=Dovyalis caffra TaxID=77055 RepID=A0AAV1SJ09_9ROSI|nr:unnamed protein product [Dovyalis caffra]